MSVHPASGSKMTPKLSNIASNIYRDYPGSYYTTSNLSVIRPGKRELIWSLICGQWQIATEQHVKINMFVLNANENQSWATVRANDCNMTGAWPRTRLHLTVLELLVTFCAFREGTWAFTVWGRGGSIEDRKPYVYCASVTPGPRNIHQDLLVWIKIDSSGPS